MSSRTWILTDHICRSCGGRILKCVSGNGMTPGGNSIHMCADCGKASTTMGTDGVCWCGFSMKANNHIHGYICVPFSILEKYPDKREKLLNAFLACGCAEGRQSVGIMLTRDLDEIIRF